MGGGRWWSLRDRRRAAWVALAAWCGGLFLVASALGLAAANVGSNAGLEHPVGHDSVFMVWAAAYSSVGALIAARRSGNAIGWILLAAGIVLAASSAGFEFANLSAGQDAAVGSRLALWVSENLSPTALALIAAAVLLFPDGKLPSDRWRAALVLPVGAIFCLTVGLGLFPGQIDPHDPIQNPVGVAGAADVLTAVQIAGWGCLALSFAAAALAIRVRFRRAQGATKQQLKWVAFAAAMLGITWAQWTFTYLLPARAGYVAGVELALVTIAIAGIPVAIGIAILRNNLYEIDVIIQKTLTYTALLVILAVVYLGGVSTLGWAFRTATAQSGPLAVTISTLAVAVAFQPLRRRLQLSIDHRFYRRHYDAVRTITAFTDQLRQEIDLDTLQHELLTTINHTLQPAHATLWLQTPAAPHPSTGDPLR